MEEVQPSGGSCVDDVMDALPEAQLRPGTPTRVVVVHGSDVIRAGLAAVLAREPGVEVIQTAGCVEDAMRSIATRPADVIVLDLVLPHIRGWAACAEMVRSADGAAVIVLAASVEDALIHACLRAGARGFLPRDASAREVVWAVRAAARGEPALSPAVVDRLVEWARRATRLPIDDQSLGPHEVETISLVAQGLKTSEMAERLGVSQASVKLYLRSAMRKLGVHERSSAVAACIRRGVI